MVVEGNEAKGMIEGEIKGLENISKDKNPSTCVLKNGVEDPIAAAKKSKKHGMWILLHLVVVVVCLFIGGGYAAILGVNSAVWALLLYKLGPRNPGVIDPAFLDIEIPKEEDPFRHVNTLHPTSLAHITGKDDDWDD